MSEHQYVSAWPDADDRGGVEVGLDVEQGYPTYIALVTIADGTKNAALLTPQEAREVAAHLNHCADQAARHQEEA